MIKIIFSERYFKKFCSGLLLIILVFANNPSQGNITSRNIFRDVKGKTWRLVNNHYNWEAQRHEWVRWNSVAAGKKLHSGFFWSLSEWQIDITGGVRKDWGGGSVLKCCRAEFSSFWNSYARAQKSLQSDSCSGQSQPTAVSPSRRLGFNSIPVGFNLRERLLTFAFGNHDLEVFLQGFRK